MSDIKDLEGLEISLGFKCNINCIFCYQKDLRYRYVDNIEKVKVLELLYEGFEKGKRFVIFSGGEPTLDDNLGIYIAYSKNLGYEHIRVHTNGFKFKDYSYLEKLYENGLTGVIISIHGYNEIHNKITGVKGSFDIILKSLINFEKLKRINNNFIIDTNTVICKDNYKYLEKIVYFLSKFNITRGQLVLSYSLKLFSYKEKEKIIPEYKDMTPFLIKSLNIALKYNQKIVIENIPFCLIDKLYWKNITDRIIVIRDNVTVDNLINNSLDNYNKLKLNMCNNCKLNNICSGIPDDYIKLYPDIILNPIYD